MIITVAALQALRTGFRTLFNNALKEAKPLYAAMTTTVTSSTKVETYGFLGDFPIFRKWLGPKRIKSMQEKAYQLTNDDFEATIGIHKNKIKDDNLGLYGPMVSGWAQDAGALADRLAFEALADGHLRPCYDGQNFFDTDHPMGPDDTATSNMSGASAVQPWYLLDCSKPLKPILYQDREAPHFHMVTDMEDSHVFQTGEYLMGAEARGAAGYTFWQLAHRSTATLNEANYVAAKAAMAALKNDENESLAVKPTHLVVGTSNVAAARNLIEKANLAGGESNIYFKDVILVEAPRLP
ncbi:head protein [Caulobacter sp. SLTY]|uniref:Mu-like prophage major head subunit gpT family protein n=1 Tax=Caulobacter sp. SLTY TaxID=2683262 RepID=UPI001411E780|nr:Mu-like prophage major head subunit gpT family protein [Caulobacter sp. SLTY]NBB17043.1 head protein [Caulobacter sp. SLTY]